MPTRTTRSQRGPTTTSANASSLRRSPRSRLSRERDTETGGDPIWDPPPSRTYDHGATLLDMLDVIDGTQRQPTTAMASSSSSSSSSPAHSHSLPNGNTNRRFTAAEKGKGRAAPAEPITISDNEGEDEAIVVTGVKRKVHEVEDDEGDGDSEVVDGALGGVTAEEKREEVEGEAEEEGVRLGEFSELWLCCANSREGLVLMASVPGMFFRTDSGRHDRVVSHDSHWALAL